MRSGVGMSRSKKVLKAAEQQRPDVTQKRRWWNILVQSKACRRLVFFDETGADTKMTRRYGWGLRSSRVVGHVPQGHWKTTTFAAALRASGVIAPLVLDGPMNGECFLAYIRQFLVPALEPGDLVVMDNLSSHKQSAVGEAIRQVGAEVYYLPPYSPDLNPIEKMFAKLKTLLRKSAERTTDGLWNRIGVLLDLFTPSECLNYIRSCGYSAQES
jgi:transposase